jgi:hypothetical protein
VNFTREPIIETVITPREGCNLVVRSSKGVGQEDYFVDAVEVVSFGQSLFFRSLERPKSFLVPVSDYEILELKETRMVLKNIPSERSIKIGGGRETPVRAQPREPQEEMRSEEGVPPMERLEKKRNRRSRRRRGGGGQGPMEQRPEPISEHEQPTAPTTTTEGAEKNAEEPAAAPSFISKLFPPPPTLIKETLSRYKTSDEGIIIEEKPSFPEDLEPPVSEEKPKPKEEKSSEED